LVRWHWLGGLGLLSCREPLDDNLSDVDELRVVAMTSDPPEAPPGAQVAYRALVLDASGVREDVTVDWAYCLAPRPLAESGPVHRDCLANSPALEPIGQGLSVSGELPRDACRLFGPSPPEPEPGQPAGRPVDPDATGGYYQPVRLRAVDEERAVDVLGSTRIACALAGAGPAEAAEFAQRYRSNENPRIDGLRLHSDEAGAIVETSSPGGESVEVLAGSRVVVSAVLARCAEEDLCGDLVCGIDETAVECPGDCAPSRGCSGAERYLSFDVESRALVERREVLLASWFSTGGQFDSPRTGSATSRDGGTEILRGTWIAPNEPGPATIVAVVRDDRGGSDWVVREVTVRAR
jgi:hypothetical protein